MRAHNVCTLPVEWSMTDAEIARRRRIDTLCRVAIPLLVRMAACGAGWCVGLAVSSFFTA